MRRRKVDIEHRLRIYTVSQGRNQEGERVHSRFPGSFTDPTSIRVVGDQKSDIEVDLRRAARLHV